MKLKTEMEGGCVHALGYCIDSDSVSPLEVARLEHDASAAHAYQQAINEWTAGFAASWVEARADEIMHEWGYERAGQGAEG